MRKLLALMIIVPIIFSIKYPVYKWSWDDFNFDFDFDFDFNSLIDKFKSLVPDFIKNMQKNIKDFITKTDTQKNEFISELNTQIANIQKEIEAKKDNIQDQIKQVMEKATETAKYVSYIVCDAAKMDYEECRSDKKKLLSNLLGIVQENFGECSTIVGEITKLSENFELNLKYLLFLANAISENPDALEKGKSQIVYDILNCLQDKFEEYWPTIQAKLGDQEKNVKIDVTNLLLNSYSNLVNVIHFDEIDGYIQKANDLTGLISDEQAKKIQQGIFNLLKKFNEFGEGFYNISANIALNVLTNPGNLDVNADAEIKWVNNDEKGIRIALHSNYMLREKGAQSLQAVVFDSPLVSLRGTNENKEGTSNTFVGITLYDKDGNEILVKDFNIEDLRPAIFFKKKLFGAMKTCLYYNEDAGTIENTGISSLIEKLDGEEYIKCIPQHLSSFTIGTYESAEISPKNTKTVVIVVVCVVVGIALLVGGFFLFRYLRRRKSQI